MNKDIERRLAQLESKGADWVSELQCVDFVGLCDYSTGEWEEIHHDEFVAVFRNTETGEIRGVYADRRSEDQIMADGGDLAFL